jgi:hypothetical protein
MEFDTRLSADYAGGKLDAMIDRARRDTLALVDKADPSDLVRHFQELRARYRELKNKIESLEKEVDFLSSSAIPDLFASKHITSIRIEDLGLIKVNNRWVASMPDREAGMDWLRETGNGALIIETVNSQTLASFAKDRALEGNPLPENLFRVGTSPYTSITKS